MKYPQVAADLGMENNNLACDQKQLNINGAEKIGYSCHIFGDEPNCKINYVCKTVYFQDWSKGLHTRYIKLQLLGSS